MDPRLINSLGLIFGIVGAILIWHYGLPPDVNRQGTSAILLESVSQDEIKKGKQYDFMSRAGLLCLIISFALQLVSTWMPSQPRVGDRAKAGPPAISPVSPAGPPPSPS